MLSKSKIDLCNLTFRDLKHLYKIIAFFTFIITKIQKPINGKAYKQNCRVRIRNRKTKQTLKLSQVQSEN